MAVLIHKTTCELRRVSRGVADLRDWIVLRADNPDEQAAIAAEVARIEAIPQRYRTIIGGAVQEMKAAEKQAVDDALAAAAEAARLKAEQDARVAAKSRELALAELGEQPLDMVGRA